MDANQALVDDLTGVQLAGKYRVVRRLGQGLVGTVYLCQALADDAEVAVKVLRPEVARNPRTLERFEREALTGERLDQHPNIVPVIESGEDLQHRLLLVFMEYIDGRDLEQVIAEDWPLSHNRVIGIMSQVLTALSAAHALGIVHRDLKPKNILLRPLREAASEDHVLVSDFGLARLAPFQLAGAARSAAARLHQISGEAWVVGSPEYASPEQVRGETLDERSDIYAAGVVLFRLLTRTLPFVGETPLAVALKQCSALPPPPSGFARVDSRLEVVCLKALSKTAGARYQTALEMQSALEAARAPEVAARTVWRRFGNTPARPERSHSEPAGRGAPRLVVDAQPVEAEFEPRRSSSEPAAASFDSPYTSRNSQLAKREREPAAQVRDIRHPSSLAPTERVVPIEPLRIPKRHSGMVVLSSLAVGLVAWVTFERLWNPDTSSLSSAANVGLQAPPARHAPSAPPFVLPPPEQTETDVIEQAAPAAAAAQDTTSSAATAPAPLAADAPHSTSPNDVAHPLSVNGASLANTRHNNLADIAREGSPSADSNPAPTDTQQGESPPQPVAADDAPLSVAALERLARGAQLSIGPTFTRANIQGRVVRDAFDKVAMTECYQGMLIQRGVPLTPIEARLDIETNEDGHITFAALRGALPKPLRVCIEHIARATTISEPQHVEASVTLTFAVQ
jgi:serine/threonine protein kinase